jgi:hypothetical protein
MARFVISDENYPTNCSTTSRNSALEAQKIGKNELRHYLLPLQKSTSFEIFVADPELRLESSFF